MKPAASTPFAGPAGLSGPAGAGRATFAIVPVSARVDALLDAAEAVIVRDGIASLTLDAVAAEAKVSKGGLLHHFPNKDRLVEALVLRTANAIRSHNEEAYQSVPEGPGRMARGLLSANLRDMQEWCVTCQRSSAATFAALAHNPRLLEPMRAAYADLHRRVAADGLPDGVGDAVVAAIDGLWLYWVLGLMPVDQAMIVRVRKSLEKVLADAAPARPAPARRKPAAGPRRTAAKKTAAPRRA